MSDTVLVALLSLVGTLGGTFGGILTSSKLTAYRLEQLEFPNNVKFPPEP